MFMICEMCTQGKGRSRNGELKVSEKVAPVELLMKESCPHIAECIHRVC